jgi:[acyl-carrier-protein] S-malonyltransferase
MGGLAFLFPGQGAQYLGMGLDHLRQSSAMAARLAEAGEVLGEDLVRLLTRGPRPLLARTDIAQVAIFTLSVALHERLRAAGLPAPDVVAGHSLGQFSALVAADVLEFSAALRLVAERGRLMHLQNQACDGAMMAVAGLQQDALPDLPGDVWLANFNAADQTILSGLRPALTETAERLKAAGGRGVWLDVAGPYHTPLFDEAAERFARVLDSVTLRPAKVPVIANTSARLLRAPEDVRAELRHHMIRPVLWRQSMETMAALPLQAAVEIGPGKVLKGLLLRCAPNLPCHVTDTARDVAAMLAQLATASQSQEAPCHPS